MAISTRPCKTTFLYRNNHVSPVPPRPRNLTGSNRSERPMSGVSGSLRRGVGAPPAPEPDFLADVEPPPAADDEPQPIFSVRFERNNRDKEERDDREKEERNDRESDLLSTKERKRELGRDGDARERLSLACPLSIECNASSLDRRKVKKRKMSSTFCFFDLDLLPVVYPLSSASRSSPSDSMDCGLAWMSICLFYLQAKRKWNQKGSSLPLLSSPLLSSPLLSSPLLLPYPLCAPTAASHIPAFFSSCALASAANTLLRYGVANLSPPAPLTRDWSSPPKSAAASRFPPSRALGSDCEGESLPPRDWIRASLSARNWRKRGSPGAPWRERERERRRR